ncbi:MAG: hypothetical protein D6826_02830, partial [Alphaproteobacteria bacterium]
MAAVAAAIFLALVIHAAAVVLGHVPVLDGGLVDADAYLRLVRVEELWRNGAWFDATLARVDPPDGFELHWTRPLDVLLLAGAGILGIGMPFERALYWWGVALGPLLQIATIAVFLWATGPLLPRRWRGRAAFLFVAQPAIFLAFLIGRPDHHGLLVLLATLLIGWTLRSLLAPEKAVNAFAAGTFGALAVWVSIESLLPVAVALAGLVVSWTMGHRHALEAGRRFSLAFLIGLIIAGGIERGAGLPTADDIDRLSRVHVLLAAINLALWMVLERLERAYTRRHHRSRPGRCVILIGLAAAAGAAILFLIEPRFFADPMRSGDSLYLSRHQAFIDELQPLFVAPEGGGPDGVVAALVRPLLWLGITVPALVWLGWRLLRTVVGPTERT